MIHAGIRVTKLGNSSVRYEIALYRNDDELPAGYFVHCLGSIGQRRPTTGCIASSNAGKRIVVVVDMMTCFDLGSRMHKCASHRTDGKPMLFRMTILLAASAALTLSPAHAGITCTVMSDAKSGKLLARDGVCDVRVTPASTFKVAISLMGYDAGFLKDEHAPTLPFHEGYIDWSPLGAARPIRPSGCRNRSSGTRNKSLSG